MTTNVPLVIAIVIAYVILNALIIRKYHVPQKTMETYSVGDRKMHWLLVTISYLGGWYTGGIYTGFVASSADLGLFAQYVCVYSLSSITIMYLMSRPVWTWGKHYELETVSDFVGLRYNSANWRRFITIFVFVLNGTWMIIELVTLGYILFAASNGVISLKVGIILAGCFVAFYTTFGGVRASAVAAGVQGFTFILLGTIFFFYLIWKTYGGIVPLFTLVTENAPNQLIVPKEGGLQMLWVTSIITGTLGAYIWPTSFNKLYMVSCPRELKKSVFVSPICAIVGLFAVLATALGGNFLPGFPEDSQLGIFWIANTYSGPVALAFVTLIVGSAALTTVSSIVNAISVPFAKDYLALIFPNTSVLKLAKICTAVVGFVAIIFAIMDVPQLNMLAIMLYGVVVQAIIPIFLGIYWRRGNSIGGAIGMVVGSIFALSGTFWPSLFDWTGGLGGPIVGLLLNLIIYIIGGFAFKKMDHVDEMFDVLKLYDNEGVYWPNELTNKN